MGSVVVRDPDAMSGEPVFRRTRVLVHTLFEYLKAGHSVDHLLEGFPTVSREMAVQALDQAKQTLLASYTGTRRDCNAKVRILLDECVDEGLRYTFTGQLCHACRHFSRAKRAFE